MSLPTIGGVASGPGVLLLTDARVAAAAALAPQTDTDPMVHADVVDSLTPPALMLAWADPWMEARTIGSCLWDARLDVYCIAARIEPAPGIETLEQLVAYTLGRLHADTPHGWALVASQSPRRFPIGGITYLGARLTMRVPVTI